LVELLQHELALNGEKHLREQVNSLFKKYFYLRRNMKMEGIFCIFNFIEEIIWFLEF